MIRSSNYNKFLNVAWNFRLSYAVPVLYSNLAVVFVQKKKLFLEQKIIKITLKINYNIKKNAKIKLAAQNN